MATNRTLLQGWKRRAMAPAVMALGLAGTVGLAIAPSDALAQIAKNEAAASPWGPTDEIGTLNMMTDATRLDVLRQVAGGKVYDLGVDLFIGMPICCGPFGVHLQIQVGTARRQSLVEDLLGSQCVGAVVALAAPSSRSHRFPVHHCSGITISADWCFIIFGSNGSFHLADLRGCHAASFESVKRGDSGMHLTARNGGFAFDDEVLLLNGKLNGRCGGCAFSCSDGTELCAKA